jgi:hypothetical protein
MSEELDDMLAHMNICFEEKYKETAQRMADADRVPGHDDHEALKEWIGGILVQEAVSQVCIKQSVHKGTYELFESIAKSKGQTVEEWARKAIEDVCAKNDPGNIGNVLKDCAMG